MIVTSEDIISVNPSSYNIIKNNIISNTYQFKRGKFGKKISSRFKKHRIFSRIWRFNSSNKSCQTATNIFTPSLKVQISYYGLIIKIIN